MSSAPSHPASLDNIFGAALIGIILSATLFGIYTSQVYTYFGKYPKDKLWMKIGIVALWVVQAFLYSTNIHMLYTYLINDWGMTAKLAIATWDWLIYVATTSVCATTVQCFFAWRAHRLIRQPIMRWIIPLTIVSLSFVQLVMGFAVMSLCYKLKIFLDFSQLTWGVDIWLATACACDILIMLSMCYFLHTSRTGIKKTDRLINKLMAYSIQTGGITSVTEIICFATFTGGEWHSGHILVVFSLGGLYVTSLLANLHARVPTATRTATTINSTNFIALSPPTLDSSHTAQSVENGMKFDDSCTTTRTLQDDKGNPVDTKFEIIGENDIHGEENV